MWIDVKEYYRQEKEKKLFLAQIVFYIIFVSLDEGHVHSGCHHNKKNRKNINTISVIVVVSDCAVCYSTHTRCYHE